MIRFALSAILLAACSSNTENASTPAEPEVAGTATLTVELRGFRNDAGAVRVGLYAGPRGFPRDRKAAIGGKVAPIRDRRATVRFEQVPATRVALAVLHDEDGDGKMKRGFLGQPKEGYGFSRDAPVRFGPPDFADAAVDLAAGEHKTIKIRIRY